ncbi:hypothetical protein KXR83_11845 [Williamsia muralis]|uniref:hypothetical protein n=1 Tax=Williamsia marianensis TaxID=85044 RepID=UPI003F1660C2
MAERALNGDHDAASSSQINTNYRPLSSLPARLGSAFCAALPETNCTCSRRGRTPQSRGSLGDFTDAQPQLPANKNLGVGTNTGPAAEDPDLAYMKIFDIDLDTSSEVTADMPYDARLILTRVNTSVEWRVHHLGNYVLPEDIEH